MRPAARSIGPDRAGGLSPPRGWPSTGPCLPRLHTLEDCAWHIRLSVSAAPLPGSNPASTSPGPSVPLNPTRWDLLGSGPLRTEGGVGGGHFDLTQWAGVDEERVLDNCCAH